MTISHRIHDSLYLVQEYVNRAAVPAVQKPKNTNHVFVFDCSGSMWGQLDKVKEHVKNKLPSLISPGDTVSAIWFSGRGDFGMLFEQMPMVDVKDIANVNEAFEKWLRPRGATGFKEPIAAVRDLKITNGHPLSLIFMSDGQDNAWPRADVLKELEETGKHVASVTIVEYGFYADRAFLAQMAAKVGGSHVFAEDFRTFAPVFDAAMKRKVSGRAKVKLTLAGDVIGGMAWRVDTNAKEITSYLIEGSACEVPADTSSIFYLSPKAVGTNLVGGGWKEGHDEALPGLYAALSLFGTHGKPDLVLALLKASGDVRLIKQFTNCFGKQKYSEFTTQAASSAYVTGERLTDGYNPDVVPAEDAFTVVELLQLLADNDGNRVLLDHKDFKYKRIGREIVANEDALKFEADWNLTGYSVRSLVFNEERPNVSISVVKTGKVNLAKETGRPTNIPEEFITQVNRNYAIIKDGLVNVDLLPIRVTPQTLEAFKERGFSSVDYATVQHEDQTLYELVINLRELPVINRKMVRELSAEAFFQNAYETMKAKAAQKVFGHYYKEFTTKGGGVVRTSEGLEAKYGTTEAAWLRERGLTDHGFAPHGTSAAVTDFYMGKELSVGLKGLSSLPTVADAIAKLEKAAEQKKTKGDKAKPAVLSVRLMEPFIKEIEEMLATKRPDAIKKAWLDTQQSIYRGKARDGMAKTAQDMICVTIGQVWFAEFKSLEENMLTIKTPEGDLACKVEQREIEIKL